MGHPPAVLNFLCKYPPRSDFYHAELLGEQSPMHDEIVLDRWKLMRRMLVIDRTNSKSRVVSFPLNALAFPR